MIVLVLLLTVLVIATVLILIDVVDQRLRDDVDNNYD